MKSIVIAGGGLAGLTLGIELRNRGVPVTIYEAGSYPRHRVCGEFISGRGRAILDRIGVWRPIQQAGAGEARRAKFFSRRMVGTARALPHPAICISRFDLDNTLAGEFRRRGGELREGSRWSGAFGEGCVRATGRRVEAESGGWRWFGLKAHARGVVSDCALEMHLLPRGYVGLTRLSRDAVNVCGLFRTRAAVTELRLTWENWLCGPVDSILRQHLRNAVFQPETFCAVAGVPICQPPRFDDRECSLGDAIAMMAPLTGNGMSMAFESAALAVRPLEDFSRGAVSWKIARGEIARRCEGTFGKRWRFARWLERLAFAGFAADLTVGAVSVFPVLWELFYRRTH